MSRVERKWCQHGLNPELVRPRVAGPVFDYSRGDPITKQLSMLRSGENLNPTRDAILSVPYFKGFVLRADYGFAADSWYAKVYNTFLQQADQAMHGPPADPLAVKVLIPELSCLPCPDKIGEKGEHGIIDLHTTFYTDPSFNHTKKPVPGTIVMVDFMDRVNLEGGIYLGEMDGRFHYTPSSQGAQGLFSGAGEPPIFSPAEAAESEVTSLARVLIRECGFGFDMATGGTKHKKFLASNEYAAVAWVAVNRRNKWSSTITDVVYNTARTRSGRRAPVWSAGAGWGAKLNTALVSARRSGGDARVNAVMDFARRILSNQIPSPIGKRTAYIHIATQLKLGRKLPNWIVTKGHLKDEPWEVPGSGTGLLKADKKLVDIGCAANRGGKIIVPSSRLPSKGAARYAPLTVGRATFV
jgi:hypothetical protein